MFRFRKPQLAVVLLLIVAEVGFVSAALWQWRRGEFKDARAADFASALVARADAPRRGIDDLLADTADFSAARVHGRLLTDHVLLLDNRIEQGEYGVDVFAPLALDGGGHLLVNLGWIAADRSRRSPPQVPALPVEFDASGLIAPPPAAGLLSDVTIDPKQSNPQLLLAIVPSQVSAALQLSPMLGRVFLPAPESGSPFRRDWKPSGMGADKHRGYALQWASFALIAVLLFVFLHVRRKEPSR